jgi:hypothetical protein
VGPKGTGLDSNHHLGGNAGMPEKARGGRRPLQAANSLEVEDAREINGAADLTSTSGVRIRTAPGKAAYGLVDAGKTAEQQQVNPKQLKERPQHEQRRLPRREAMFPNWINLLHTLFPPSRFAVVSQQRVVFKRSEESSHIGRSRAEGDAATFTDFAGDVFFGVSACKQFEND